MSSRVPKFLLDLDVDVGLQGDIDGLCLSWGTPRTGDCSAGVRALMLAVLEEAIQSYLSLDRRTFEEAERWIASTRNRSPFSFNVVCETLGLEPAAARRALFRLRDKNVNPKTLRRSRPNARGAGRSPRGQ
jgi:hypothetical protein